MTTFHSLDQIADRRGHLQKILNQGCAFGKPMKDCPLHDHRKLPEVVMRMSDRKVASVLEICLEHSRKES